MRGIIYKYTSPSGKCYIGQTRQEKRRKYIFNNLNQSYGSAKINNARNKYKPEGFIYEILFETELENIDELASLLGKKEISYIKEFDSVTNGYNHQEGGLYQVNIISQESRDRQAAKVSKAILQYSINGIFIKEWKSTMDIERTLDIHHSLISANCVGRTTHCRKFIFKHKSGGIIQENIILDKPIRVNNTKRLHICQVDNEGKEINRWKSISAASRELNICRRKLKKIANSGEVINNFTYKLIK